jgi:hypothetical protein
MLALAGVEMPLRGPPCRWHRCRLPIAALRASRRYCSDTCRVAAHRARASAAKLRACTFGPIGRQEARKFIVPREWLRSLGNCCLFFGLRDPDERLLSVVGFSTNGPNGARCPTLSRGASLRRAPFNTASHTIAKALRYGAQHLGWTRVKASATPTSESKA